MPIPENWGWIGLALMLLGLALHYLSDHVIDWVGSLFVEYLGIAACIAGFAIALWSLFAPLKGGH